MPNTTPSFIAGGTIQPSRLVAVSADNTVIAGSALTSQCRFVSQKPTMDCPGLTGAGTHAALVGDPVPVYGPGDVAPVELGGTVVAGDWIASGAAGVGVTSATAGTCFVGFAITGGSIGELIPVFIHPRTI